MKSILTILPFVLSLLNLVDVNAQTIIVGSGPAAIQAAATLLEKGEDFIILAQSDQLGGYLNTVEFDGRTFAPGSLFGYTPIKGKLEDLDIPYKEPDWFSYTAFNDAGENVTEEVMQREFDWFTSVVVGYQDILEDLLDNIKPDISQKAAIARGGWSAYTAVDKVAEWWNIDFFQGLSARDGSTINAYRQGGLYPDTYFILDDRTLRYPLIGSQEESIPADKIVYNERVRIVNQTDGDYVTVYTESGSEYIGKYVIVTNTIGVLQNGGVTFAPPLPPWKYEEFCRWQMGTVDVIFLKFNNKFWDDTEFILHASDTAGYYPAFMNLDAEGYYPGSNTLIAFITGDEAYRMERLTDDAIEDEVVEVLRNMYPQNNVRNPREIYVSRFRTDEDLFGSFATWPIGTLPEDGQKRLRAHVGRVYFAPEDAADEYIGIPFGSINDGRAAAEGVVRCIQEGNCDEYTPVDSTLPLCQDVNPTNPKKYRKREP